ncbi:MAG: FumA C-terminus/TtdB family hydratase beta subunit, partial [Pseudomonadota bacterium]
METISQKTIGEVAYNLLANAATRYPKNYLAKLLDGLKNEEDPGSRSVIVSMIQNIIYASGEKAPLCQDTGIPLFHVYLNPGISVKGDISAALTEASIRATDEVPIRKNVIEPFTFQNPGNNTGWGVPFVHFYYSAVPGPMRIRAELKGFGGEIKSNFDWILTSTENMENAVLAYVLNNVLLSKGENCVPGFIGIGVGGYASEAVSNAKNALFRELTSKASERASGPDDPFLRGFEQRVCRCVNKLGLGPMGNGGKTTTLGVYLERRGTHTAVSPVAVSQQCWASRGSEALIGENRVDYLTPHVMEEDLPALNDLVLQELSKSGNQGNIYELSTPIREEDLLKLRIWDVVYLNGTICTSRDRAHRRMIEKIKEGKRGDIPREILENGVIYHCGPVIAKEQDRWSINAAGPTTSSRFTHDAAFLVEQGVIRAAIGKGTMGNEMVEALRGRGVYLKAVGGCGVSYKKMIRHAEVKWEDLGYPEAAWIFDVHRFGPLVVGIDSKGHSLTYNAMERVYENARNIYLEEGLDP